MTLAQLAAAPGMIAFQPTPLSYKVRTLYFPGGQVAAAVERVWNVGDTHRCQLCRQCSAVHERGTCVVLVNGPVEGDSALLFECRGLAPSRPG